MVVSMSDGVHKPLRLASACHSAQPPFTLPLTQSNKFKTSATLLRTLPSTSAGRIPKQALLFDPNGASEKITHVHF